MQKVAHKSELTTISHLPREVFSTVETVVEMLDNVFGNQRKTDLTDGGFIVILEPNDSLKVLEELGIETENLFAEYTEVIVSTEASYSYSLLFHVGRLFIVLIMPLFLTPLVLLDSFYVNVNHEDLACESMEIDEDYQPLALKLTASYSEEQMRLYIALETAQEGRISDLKETFYRKGFKDAVQAVYQSICSQK